MISPNDTMAANLCHVNAEYAGRPRFEHKPKRLALSSVAQPVSPARPSTSNNDDNNDLSELPYLSTEPIESRPDSSASSPMVDVPVNSEIDSSVLTAMLFGDSHGSSSRVGPIRSGTAFTRPHPAPKLFRSSSRPVLIIDLGSHSVDEFSLPSPVDSGYGSRPDTPFVDKSGESKEEETWSPVDDLSSISDESFATHTSLDASSDGRHSDPIADAKAAPAQGPVIPRIVLVDEEGRVSDAVFDDQSEGCFPLPASVLEEDINSPYGGLMSMVSSPNSFEPLAPVPSIVADSKIKNSATGAVLDRVFVPFTRPRGRTVPPNDTPIYRNRHRAPTFVLDCVGEEEEEEADIIEQEALVLGDAKNCVDPEASVRYGESWAQVDNPVTLRASQRLTGEDPDTIDDLMSHHVPFVATQTTIRSSLIPSTPNNVAKLAPSRLEDDEDGDCEECGLCFTVPDDHYSRLMTTICPPQVQPGIVFGLLRTYGRSNVKRELNTVYHVAVEGRTPRLAAAHCTFDCERGYWAEASEVACIPYPRECPAHGGHGACEIGAIFRPSTAQFNVSAADLGCTAPDYESHAVEIVGAAPSRPEMVKEDFEDEVLVLHSAEKLHGVESKDATSEAGTGYDEYMSRFMDDVDLTSSNSADAFKGVPLGKFGGALKELRDATMPEAVDHLREGLGKTESVFRAFTAGPFKFNTVADKIIPHLKSAEQKTHPTKEKRASNGFYRHARESSVPGMKAKWSNMLNRFTR